jgi:F-type H+-transporting ATPase subunit b
MPQFDFANVFVPQLIWLGIIFAALYFGIVQRTLPKLGGVMDAREAKVKGDIAAAEAAKARSDKLAEDYAAGLDAAHQSARKTIADTQTKAQANIDAVLAETDAKLTEKLAAADAALAVSRGKALAEVETVATTAAADIIERLTGKRPASGVMSKAVKVAAGSFGAK